MVKVLTNKTYVCSDLAVESVERGNVARVVEYDETFVAFTAGTCPETRKSIKLILKGKLAFFIYTNFLEDIGTVSRRSICPSTGVAVQKIARVSFTGTFKEERSKEIICTPEIGSEIKFNFEYLVENQ